MQSGGGVTYADPGHTRARLLLPGATRKYYARKVHFNKLLQMHAYAEIY